MILHCRSNTGATTRLLYRYQSGEAFSKTLVAQVEIEQHIAQKGPGIQRKIESAREKREGLMTTCQSQGLKLIARTWDKSVDDLEGNDAEGRLIECSVTVEVSNAEEAAKAIQICKEKNLMAMPIGARTSGLGVFEAMGTATQKGFEGVLGIQMKKFEGYESDEGKEEKPARNLIEIPGYDTSKYDLVRHRTLPLALLKSKTFPEDATTPHRVIAHAGCTVDVVNQFLREKLPDDRFTHRIINDLTTRKEAQLGGVISTGAEGGNRSKPTEDIVSTGIVNANGEIKTLDREQSQKIIGLNGATLVTQVEFEVTALPKHEHAIFIPIKGVGEERWKNMLRLQHKLSRYCRPKNGNRRALEGDTANGLIITGMEPLSRGALQIALETKDSSTKEHYEPMLADDELGIYVTFNSFNTENESVEDELMALMEEDFGKALGTETVDFEADDAFNERTGNLRVKDQPTHGELRIFSKKEREAMDEIRHGAPSHSKEKATKLGGQTQSTDLNIRFTDEDPETRERAIAAIAKIYQEYEEAFKPEDGFRVVIYGHLHPGLTEEGGGFDPHIRIIFELSNPGSRYNAPEKVVAMKKRQTKLYEKLLALNGIDGIEVRCPEKSRFTNKEYWKWLCLYKPDEARGYVEALEEHGYSRTESGELDRPIIGSRIPHELAGKINKVPGGIKALFNKNLIDPEDPGTERIAGMDPLLKKYWKAILEISQLSHRGGLIKRMLGEVQRSLHDTFGLTEKQYALFIEDPTEGKKIVERNFGEDYETLGYKVEHVAAESLEAFHNKFPDDQKTFYVVNLQTAGMPRGLSILIAPHDSIKDAYERTVDGRNKASFRNPYTMWDKWPYETQETPNLPAIAALGVLLQRNELDQHPGADRPDIVTTNPGPAQIHEAIQKGTQELFELVKTMEDREEQKKVIAQFKRLVGIPQNHSLAFFTSATQIMQMFAEALKPKKDEVNVMQVTNDSFSESLYGILAGEGIPVKRIQTPWGTSEHSEMRKVVRALLKAWDPKKKNILFVTPHKTSTAADFLPQRLIDTLAREGKIMGRDYEMICDVTSGIGARDYATGTDPDLGSKRIPFTGLFGSLQKGGEQAPGFAAVSLSPQLKELLGLEPEVELMRGEEGGVTPKITGGDDFSLSERLMETEGGNVVNPLGLAMLKQKLDADELARRTPEKIQEETRRKVSLVMGWMQRHPDLMTLVPNALDASPLLFGIFSQSKNLVVAKRLMAEIFGYYLGGGYGPYEKEAIRLYLPNIAMEDLKDMLAALDYVLQLPDVIKTRGEKIPNIALREPHDPLSVVERVAADFSVDDIFKDSLGLHWLERLVKTYNCIQEEKAQHAEKQQHSPHEAQKIRKKLVRLGGVIPETTPEYHTRAQIYAFEENLTEMEKVLSLEDNESHLSLAHFYHQYLQIEKEIRNRVIGQPEARYGEDEGFTAEMNDLIERAKVNLSKVASLLRKYFHGNGNPEIKGARDEEDRVKTPLAA